MATKSAQSQARCRNCRVLLLLNSHNEWEDEDGEHGCAMYGGNVAHLAEWSTDPQEQARLIESAFKRGSDGT